MTIKAGVAGAPSVALPFAGAPPGRHVHLDGQGTFKGRPLALTYRVGLTEDRRIGRLEIG